MASSPPESSPLAALIGPVDDTLGAALIGFAFSCVVFGVNTNQCFTYFQRYPGDRLAYKIIVVLIWVLELVDQAFIGHAVYFYTITNYSQPLVMLLQPVAWTLIVQLTVGALIGTIVRLCFAMRVWRFSQRNITVTATVVALNLTEMGLAIAYTIKAFRNPFLMTLPNLKVLASFSLGAGVLTDVFTACALVYFLRKFRTGHKRADSLVNTLTIYAVNTGAFTAAISLLTLIFYDLRPRNFQFMAFYFILSKLYAISFLCTLNTRKIIRGKGTEQEGPTTGGSANLSGGNQFYSMGYTARSNTLGSPGDPHAQSISKGMEIDIHQEVSVSTDLDVEVGNKNPYMTNTDPTIYTTQRGMPCVSSHLRANTVSSQNFTVKALIFISRAFPLDTWLIILLILGLSRPPATPYKLPPQASFTLDNTLGAIIVGFAMACVVFGILLTQTWSYYTRFNGDAALYKFLVGVILVLETTDQALIGHFVYFYSIASAGNPLALVTGTTTWSLILQQAVGAIVGTIVKLCFASRVYRFSEKNIFITASICLLAVGQLGVALAFTLRAFQLNSIPQVFHLKMLGTISLALGVLTDVVTAGSLCFFLWRMRTGQGSAANSLINRLVTDAINTGVLTTVVSLSTLLLFDFLSGNLIFAATYFMLSKLYAVSFLATLNTRRSVRGRGTDQQGTSSRRPTTKARTEQEEIETNMFHLGTRMPSVYVNQEEVYATGYPEFNLKPGYPPANNAQGYRPSYAV
ncbi:hypothetical protein R3P38DRAFT_2720568 [Favolaschia claudopus]|uniref:DUF6534 domain-containing protein n=1 Tax=Favolaschia claudopus TaxID=2862362 RepID=A0AAW0AMV1_9AGAR